MKTIKRIPSIGLLLIWSLQLSLAQSELPYDKAFISQLFARQAYHEVILYTENISLLSLLPTQQDSLNFYKAWAYQYQHKYTEANHWLQELPMRSPLFFPAQSLRSYNLSAQSQSYQLAYEQIEQTEPMLACDREFRQIQLAMLSTLSQDYDLADKHIMQFSGEHEKFNDMSVTLIGVNHDLKTYKTRSMFLAGSLSAIIPGAGKFYAGKPYEGLSAFLVNMVFAGITAENAIKAGWTNYKTIGFGLLFGLFYAGNIYGSIASVKRQQQDFFDEKNYLLQQNWYPLLNDYLRY